MIRSIACALTCAFVLVPTAGVADGRAPYDTRTIASVPEGDNGYIEGLAFDGSTIYAGTASGITSTGLPLLTFGIPSRVFAWDRDTGALLDTIEIEGEDTTTEHALTGLKVDPEGRLLVLSNQLGVLRLTKVDGAWTQETLTAIPDLPPCVDTVALCSPTLTDRGPLPNDMTFDAAGNLYVSDSWQATIWKVTPSGFLTAWYQDASLDRMFGANGIRITPEGDAMAIAVTGPDSAEVGPVDRASRVLTVPFPDPTSGPATDLLVLPNGDLADGIAYGAEGDLYVAVNSTDRLYIVGTDGSTTIVTNDDLTGDGRMDFPASLMFDGEGALLVTNYAFFDGLTPLGTRSVIDVWVDDVGLPEPTLS